MVAYAADTPAQYLDLLEPDWRRDTLLELRRLILAAAPDWEEGIAYKMLGYSSGDELVMCLNAQKAYVSLYVGNADAVDPDGTLLAGLDRGKGCIRFKRSNAVADTRIDAFIQRAVALHGQGVDIGC